MSMGRNVVWVAILAGIVVAGLIAGVVFHRRERRPLVLTGAVIRQSTDPQKQSPIADVQIAAITDGATVATAKSDFFGYFSLRLPPNVTPGESIVLRFRDPTYLPLEEQQTVGNAILVVQLVPLHEDLESELDPNAVPVTDVLVRYSVQTTAAASAGTKAKTFQIVNQGDVPCHKQAPCSPDGEWKATVASASLDAGDGNVFRNARAFCIAGPCPFTRIDTDGFTKGGRRINITVRDWSDTTTFLLQAEVLRSQISDVERKSYPLIFGKEMDFTVPDGAEGTSLEAEINGGETIFPLGPNPELSWAECEVQEGKNQAKDYRCELKRGFRFAGTNNSPGSAVKSGS